MLAEPLVPVPTDAPVPAAEPLAPSEVLLEPLVPSDVPLFLFAPRPSVEDVPAPVPTEAPPVDDARARGTRRRAAGTNAGLGIGKARGAGEQLAARAVLRRVDIIVCLLSWEFDCAVEGTAADQRGCERGRCRDNPRFLSLEWQPICETVAAMAKKVPYTVVRRGKLLDIDAARRFPPTS